MPEDIFGIPDTPPEVQLFGEETEEQPEETTDQVVEEATEETPAERERDERGRFVAAAPEVEPEAQEEQPEAQVEQEETSALEAPEVEAREPGQEAQEILEEAAPRLWANKYQTPDDLEKGYNESREAWRRAVEARKATEQQAYEAQMREAELAKVIQESLPYLREAAQREEQFHAFAEQYKAQLGEYPPGYQGPPSPAQQRGLAPQDVNAIVEQRLQQERQQMQAEMQDRQEYEARAQSIMGFYRDHPEVEPRSPADNMITDTMTALNEAWATHDYEVDMSDRGTLEILYEASQRPALQSILSLKPDYFDSEAGLQLARMEAAVLEGAPSPTQQTQAVPASQVGKTSGQKKPFAESAVTGAEVPEEDDEWSQIKRSYQRTRDDKAVFQFE